MSDSIEASPIKKKFIGGVAYIAIAKYSGIFVSLIISGILARILTPADFGIIAIASVFIVFFNLLGDMGIGPAIIQFKDLSNNDIKSIFGFSFWCALVLSILFFFAADFIGDFYENELVTKVCKILSLQIFFTVLNIVPQALLSKTKQFKTIAVRNVIIQILCGIVAICAAFNGLGIYALLVSPILSIILNFVVNVFLMKLAIKIIPDFNAIKKIFAYSSYQFLFNFVNYFGRNLDKMIIGKYINLVELGYYEKSYRLMLMPVENISGVISPVLHPFLSDWQNDLKRINDVYQRLLRGLCTCSFPIASLLYIIAPEIILIVFGNQWESAIPCFRILALSVAFQIPCVVGGPILQACNKTNILFYLGTTNVILNISGLLIACKYWHTIEAISWAFNISSFCALLFTIVMVCKYCFRQSPFHVLKLLIQPLLLALVILSALYVISCALTGYHMFLTLLVKICVAMVIFITYTQNFTPYKLSMMLRKR